MVFFKRLILAFLALGFIYMGGSGTQSNSMLSQGGGFVGLIIGIIVLYIFFKMAWRAMGCLPSLIILFVVAGFVVYAIGGLNNGVSGLSESLKAFIGQTQETLKQGSESQDKEKKEPKGVPSLEENFTGENMLIDADEPESAFDAEDEIKKEEPVSQPQEQTPPSEYPTISGLPRVINGDTIQIGGSYVKFFGVDAAEPNQTCADKNGRSYRCGREAALWLRSWITDNDVDCKIMGRDKSGILLGACSLGQYDIGAALINAGWAVADIRESEIYVPYQQQARANQRGLWQGKFYMPADWRSLQNKKANIKVIKPKTDNKMFGF